MNSRVIWLAALALGAGHLAGSSLAFAGTYVYVIQPDTDRRTHLAVLSLRTLDGQPVPSEVPKPMTGRVGEPFEAGGAEKLDPSYGTLILEARKHGIRGQLKLSHDPDQYFWKQAYHPAEDAWKPDHDRSDWRPDTVYDWIEDPSDEEKGLWKSTDYDQWKANQVAREADRAGSLHAEFVSGVDVEIIDAVTKGAISEEGEAKIRAALEGLLSADLKAPPPAHLRQALAAALEEAVAALERQMEAIQAPAEAAPPAAPGPGKRPEDVRRAVRDLESQIEDVKDLQWRVERDLDNLIRRIRTEAPEPPVIRVQLERRYRVPVRRGGYRVPRLGCVAVPSPAVSPEPCLPCGDW